MLHAVAMAGQLGSIPCSVEKFVDEHMVALSENHGTKIEELGLGCMLQMKSVKMRNSLLKCLLDYYDPVEGTSSTGESFTITSHMMLKSSWPLQIGAHM